MNEKPRTAYWRLWADEAGVSHQQKCELTEWELKGVGGADPQWNDKQPRCSAGDGAHCIDPDGALLGKVLTGAAVGNLAFGGRHRSRLFLCAGQRLMAVYTNVRGAQWP